MDVGLALKVLAKALILPPAGPLLLALVGLAVVRRAPRLGRALAFTGVVALLLLSLPIVAWTLTVPFDRAPFEHADGAQAIVILGGGVRTDAPEYAGDTLGRLTLERVRYGAAVAKATGLPVMVSGGTPEGAKASEAALMAQALAREYGVNVRWLEAASRNTRENARYASAILKADGVTRIVLVAHAIDIPRASAEFAAAGLASVPAPTALPSRFGLAASDFLPSAAALQRSHDALYELLANVVRVVAAP